MADFVNGAIIGTVGVKRMLAVKAPGAPVQVHLGKAYEAVAKINQLICNLLSGRETLHDGESITPEDIMVLAHSVKSSPEKQTPLRVLENALAKADISAHVTNDVTQGASDDVVRGKVLLSTMHQSKGLERRVVILFCLSDRGCYFVPKNERTECPNLFYVGLTRATELLIIIGEETLSEMPRFVNE